MAELTIKERTELLESANKVRSYKLMQSTGYQKLIYDTPSASYASSVNHIITPLNYYYHFTTYRLITENVN